MKKKILIVTKHPESKGGVVNYYNHFFKVFKHENFQLEWFVIGSRPENYNNRQKRKLAYTLELVNDIFKFIVLLSKDRRIRVVQVSPSFMPVPILRDCIYLFISRLFKKKTITFFRGWSRKFEEEIISKPGFYRRRVKYYRKSDKILVLAEKFKKTLIDIGFDSSKIKVTRTMYLTDHIQGKIKSKTNRLEFLFIGRLSIQKGILDIIEAVNMLNNKGVNIDVELYGHFANKEIQQVAEKKIIDYKIKDQLKISGFISGIEKYKKLAAADVFLFPTFHDEGCPNSIIEALASGLYIISTPIGAIDEIVKDRKNGFIIPSKSPEMLAQKMEWCIKNKEEIIRVGKANKLYASKNFEQQIILSEIYKLYQELEDNAI